MHGSQALQLLVGLFSRLRRQTGLVKRSFQLVKLFLKIGIVAQFTPDSLHLFPQKIVFLRLVHAFFRHALDMRLHGSHLYFPRQVLIHKLQPFDRIETIQQHKGIADLQPHIGGNQICKPARIIYGHKDAHDVAGGDTAQVQDFFAMLSR